MAAATTESSTSRIYSIRIPDQLDREVNSIAARDANGLSATVRRLLTPASAPSGATRRPVDRSNSSQNETICRTSAKETNVWPQRLRIQARSRSMSQ
jgi:hypothetical protein